MALGLAEVVLAQARQTNIRSRSTSLAIARRNPYTRYEAKTKPESTADGSSAGAGRAVSSHERAQSLSWIWSCTCCGDQLRCFRLVKCGAFTSE